jgi:large subunit ribosomal protein L6
VSVKFANGLLEVKGPKGNLSEAMPSVIDVTVDASELRFARSDDKQENRSLHGLARALAANMVTGVTDGFAKELEIQGVGYRAEVKGNTLNLMLGFSHPVAVPVPKDLKVSVEGNTKIKIEGINKQTVGQFAADIRSLRPPEPYKGKGIRYLGEQVKRKVGKTGAV